MPQSENLYNILGLKNYASIDEVRAKFRQLAMQYHPDRNPNKPQVEELFKEMVAAYNVLSDEEKKRNYDLKLSGFYTYQKVETKEEKKAKRRAQVKRMRQRIKEKEKREIQQAYEKAKQKIPYKWRYSIAIIATIISLIVILNNWYIYDGDNGMQAAFFKIFSAYILSLHVLVFFLKSLFLKWNAQNSKKPFGFNIRNRITAFFMMYIFLMMSFSFNAPTYYKQLQLSSFGKTTTGIMYNDRKADILYLKYKVDGKIIIKNLDIGSKYYGDFNIEVEIKYSSINPYIYKIIGYSDVLDI